LVAKDGANLNKHTFLIEDDMDAVILSSIAILRPVPSLRKSPISPTMRLIVLMTPRAASWNGAAAVISLLPTPRGMSPARCFGIVNGISGRPVDTTQIGNRLPTAQATSMPT
jgi:hypothetical protein